MMTTQAVAMRPRGGGPGAMTTWLNSTMRMTVAGARKATCASVGLGLEKNGATRKNATMTQITRRRVDDHRSAWSSTSSATSTCAARVPGGPACGAAPSGGPVGAVHTDIMPSVAGRAVV